MSGPVVTEMVRWVVVAVVAGHGVVHLLGAAKGLGWAAVPQLTEPIGAWAGGAWLVAALLVLTSAALLAVGTTTWWWLVVLVAAVLSQVLVVTSWSDARYGTIANVLMLLVAGYGFASVGPTSFDARWDRQVSEATAEVEASPSVLTEADLAPLPAPLAAYVRRSGAVGEPRVTSLSATFHGRIRSGPGEAWMSFTGKQVNTFGSRPQRAFLMHATRSGLPVTVLHQYVGTTATMEVTLASVVPMVDAAGPTMDRGETVTVFNDLVVLAPGAIADAAVTWTPVDEHHVRGELTNGAHTVSAVLTFDDDHDLVDFVSDDRSRASADGRSFVQQEWSTPLSAHRDQDGRRVVSAGQGMWSAPEPEGRFSYLDLYLDDIEYNAP
ncbi:DUF6544 family protein [Jannaschia sp. R86511]|uniref:DUF6544 family protein n=1 Tax=Jannaschia sp. R86511 TaxID=3093853 RepID=UPI0036D3B4E3